MPSPKNVKRVAGSSTSRAAAVGKVYPEYPKYFVVQVKDKRAEDYFRKRLKGLPSPKRPSAISVEAMVFWSVMSNTNPPC